MDEKKDQANKKDQDAKKPVKNAVDLQKLKLDKLFKNIERPVHLPETAKKRGFSAAPEFVRNVMGSSAGAGSGEFHVYRHIRRRENARLKFIAEEASKEDKDEAYLRKLEENQVQSEMRTAKKRAKRQKKKTRQQGREKRPKVAAPSGGAPESDGDESGSEPEPAEGDREPELAEGDREPEPGPEPAEGDTEPEPGPEPAEGDREPEPVPEVSSADSVGVHSKAGPTPDRGDGDTSTGSPEPGPDRPDTAAAAPQQG